MWGLSGKVAWGNFLGWWECLHLDGMGNTGVCICQNSISGTLTICVFHYIYILSQKEKRNFNDIHVEVFSIPDVHNFENELKENEDRLYLQVKAGKRMD